jgi:hypothetical protein
MVLGSLTGTAGAVMTSASSSWAHWPAGAQRTRTTRSEPYNTGPSISRAGPPGVVATGHRPGSARSSISSSGSPCVAAIQVEDQVHEHG